MSSPATPAAPALSLRRHRARALDVSAADSVSFPELVWAHHLYIQELHRSGGLHGPTEAEYRDKLDRFVKEHGRILNAYWCTSDASAVALTEKQGARVWGFLWRRHPSIRLHSATDWVTRGAPDIGHALHTCETLAIKVTEVLAGTSERVAMQWILSVAGYLLGVVDQADGKPTTAEVTRSANRSRAELTRVEHYYDRAGENTGRLIYFWGMMLGLGALAVLAVVGTVVYTIFGTFHLKDPDTHTFYVCYTMGAVGAFVSVMTRMAGGGNFTIDYEVGRPALRRVGSFRPVIGAIFAVVLYFALRGDLIQLQTAAGENATYFYGALAFVAGFSERRAKIILGGTERMLAGEAEEGDPKPAPAKRRGSGAGNGSTG